MAKTCSINGCDSPHLARGWCNKHYGRWRTHGDPNTYCRMRDFGDGCLMPDGYIRVSVKGRMIYQHRLVMEDSLGRKLLRTETVHHINGNRSDNRLENLQLIQGHHGVGAAWRCRSCGSEDVEAVEIEC